MKTASKKEAEEEEEARVVDKRGGDSGFCGAAMSSSSPPYRFSTEGPVYFDSSAWLTIRQSFRIAISHSTVFVCDRFLGHQMATEVERELETLSKDPRFLFVGDSGGASRSVHLTEHCAQVHRAVDCTALLVYKLGCFVASSWTKATVKITEFLDESTSLHNDPYVSIGERTLKCLYFPTRTKQPRGKRDGEEERCVHLRSSSQNLDVRTKGDRLIAFWKDGMTERTSAAKNSFTICITLHKRS